jgi:hypothetical protein
MSKLFIIAPMCSGKSTFAAANPSSVFDIDASRHPDYEAILTKLRDARDWLAHNSIWYNFCVRPWFFSLPRDGTVLVHTAADVVAVDADAFTQKRVSVVLPPPNVWRDRVARRALNALDAELAEMNYAQVAAEATKYALSVSHDFPSYRSIRGAMFRADAGDLVAVEGISPTTEFLHVIDYAMGPFICPVVAVVTTRTHERPVDVAKLRKRFKPYDFRALAIGHPWFAEPVTMIEQSHIWACFLGGWPGILMDAGLPEDQWIPTLAHELGHGIAYLAEIPQSEMVANLIGSLIAQFADGLPNI